MVFGYGSRADIRASKSSFVSNAVGFGTQTASGQGGSYCLTTSACSQRHSLCTRFHSLSLSFPHREAQVNYFKGYSQQIKFSLLIKSHCILFFRYMSLMSLNSCLMLYSSFIVSDLCIGFRYYQLTEEK